ncbi:hypothetical protein [Thiothrix unzii]|uniref:Spore coat protein U domain-containing protein n=1 Tax=Thiothrix unzii TaxID=111769 RepID=A0A975IIL2_9GAMM|nr:hypothetical protein [Thiothrix unzii]QTR54783.1 hypothetical protein J9260_06750 [Thiothrix unzii]
MQFWQHFLLGVALAITALPANAISVIADDWSHSLPDNITNAGTYYNDSFTTTTSITISDTSSSSQAWTLSVRLINLVNGLTIATKRTGRGTDGNEPNGGDSIYQTLGTVFLPLFTGSGNVSNIPLEFEISNFDVTDGNGIKDIQIEYEVTIIP